VDADLLPVLEDEADRVAGKQDERDQAQPEPRLPAIVQLAGVDSSPARNTHDGILRSGCGVNGERARNQARLRRRGQPPD